MAAQRPFAARRVLLGVTGGIAAIKSLPLAREFTSDGADVDVVLTPSAIEFVRPIAFEALTGRAAHTSVFTPGEPLTHIRLAREAEVIVVAPATANFLARAAAGMADDLLTATLLATAAPVVLCPAMNDRMYAHALTQRNLRRLARIGYRIAGPAVGALAWGEGEGPGRMIEPAEIIDHAARALHADTPLAGRRIVVTAGPTREPLDPVRFLGNRSSGRMGYAIAAAAWLRGAEVHLVSGPTALPPPTGVAVERVETAEQMRAAVAAALPAADVLVMCAAVADFRPAAPAERKIKKEADRLSRLHLERTPDVLQSTRTLRPPGCVVVGFALETGDAVENGLRKLHAKGLDLLVVNDATEAGAGFEVETNRVTILHRDGRREALPLLQKRQVAEHLLGRIGALLPPIPAP